MVTEAGPEEEKEEELSPASSDLVDLCPNL